MSFTLSEFVSPVPPHLLILLQVSNEPANLGIFFLIACRHIPVVL